MNQGWLGGPRKQGFFKGREGQGKGDHEGSFGALGKAGKDGDLSETCKEWPAGESKDQEETSGFHELRKESYHAL